MATKYRIVTREWRPYRPTFRYPHNCIKAKCWLVLYDRYLGNEGSVTTSELSQLAGVNLDSLWVLILRWWKRWGYVERYDHYPFPYTYSITTEGRRWFDKWQHLMPLDRLIKEVEAAQNNNAKGY